MMINMIEENIEDIRRCALTEIKEKIKKNPKYLHPMNKEFQDDIKRYKFLNGYEYTCFLQNNGIMKNSTDVGREIHRKTANNAGFENFTEYSRIKDWNKGIYLPMADNEHCSYYFGIYIGEKYVSKIFEDPIRMPPNNPGFDWICKKGYKIQHKARCLSFLSPNYSRWKFEGIDFNLIADYFILSAWDNRNSLKPMYVWVFHRNDIVRGDPFWMRRTISITNKPRYLIEFNRYEANDKLEKLKELCKDIKKEGN